MTRKYKLIKDLPWALEGDLYAYDEKNNQYILYKEVSDARLCTITIPRWIVEGDLGRGWFERSNEEKEAQNKKMETNKEMKKIYTLTFEEDVKVKSISDQGIEFSDGTVLKHEHDQDCCEHVYADWEQLNDTTIFDETFREIEIKGNKGFGIMLSKGYFVPCYNEQNGYYSDYLDLVVYFPGSKEWRPNIKINIDSYVEDRIY